MMTRSDSKAAARNRKRRKNLARNGVAQINLELPVACHDPLRQIEKLLKPSAKPEASVVGRAADSLAIREGDGERLKCLLRSDRSVWPLVITVLESAELRETIRTLVERPQFAPSLQVLLNRLAEHEASSKERADAAGALSPPQTSQDSLLARFKPFYDLVDRLSST
ncbi:hypothetical protein ACIKTA_04535 [Hansschlegelia beijingensis]